MSAAATISSRVEPLPPRTDLARRRAVVFAFFAASVIAAIVSIGVGAVPISIGRVVGALTGQGAASDVLIVRSFRLPRQLVGASVGASLAVSGVILQSVTRNPLASPAIVGINGGAGLGALIAIMYVHGTSAWQTPTGAFIGGLAGGGAAYLLSRRDGIVNPGRLALVGVAIGGLAIAAIQLVLVLTVFVGDIQVALRWLIGSLWGRSWTHVHQIAPFVLLLLPIPWLMAPQLNLLGLGDDVPRSLGSRLETVKLGLLALAILLASASVAVAGSIAFVGLIAPHLCRRLVGPDHRYLVPAAAGCGALLVLIADALGRALLPPAEIPAGLFVAVLGSPYFLFQIRKGLGRVRS